MRNRPGRQLWRPVRLRVKNLKWLGQTNFLEQNSIFFEKTLFEIMLRLLARVTRVVAEWQRKLSKPSKFESQYLQMTLSAGNRLVKNMLSLSRGNFYIEVFDKTKNKKKNQIIFLIKIIYFKNIAEDLFMCSIS